MRTSNTLPLSLFHGETSRTAKKCALAAVNAVGFSNVRECPLRVHGGLRVKIWLVQDGISLSKF